MNESNLQFSFLGKLHCITKNIKAKEKFKKKIILAIQKTKTKEKPM